MSKARNQVFLMAIKDVTIPGSPPKGGTFVFEVKFNGKEGSWILNAPSEVSLSNMNISRDCLYCTYIFM